jgi:undecaprenyl-diphosphatase
MFQTLVNLDTQIFHLINGSIHTDFLDWFFLFFSFYPLIIWFSLGLMIVFIEERKDKVFIIKLGLALVAAGFVSTILIKPIVRRPRPDITHGESVILVAENAAAVPFNNDFSFPSGHATIAFAGAYIVSREEESHKSRSHSRRYKRFGKWLFYGVAALTAFSRIYLGKHYPSDVVVGALLGYAIGWGVWEGVNRISLSSSSKARS